MKRLVIVPHFSDDSLKEIMNTQSDVRSFKDWQIIYFLQTNPRKQIKEIAQMLCVSRSKILRSVQLYNQFGESWRPCGQLGGRREILCHLSLAD